MYFRRQLGMHKRINYYNYRDISSAINRAIHKCTTGIFREAHYCTITPLHISFIDVPQWGTCICTTVTV